MKRIDFRLGDKSDWVKVFDPRDCSLYVVCDEPPPVGDQLRVDLAIADAGPRIILRGTVISRHTEAGDSHAAGCTVSLAAEEREKINYLNGFVRGGMLDLRATRRLPLRLVVTYGGVDGPCESYTRDINEEGIFVVTEDPLPEESEIHLIVKLPGSDRTLSLAGYVSHTVVVEDEDVPGMGIVFECNDEQQQELSDVVDELEKAFLAGTLPDEALL